MAPTLEFNTQPWSWSTCSAKYLKSFLDKYTHKQLESVSTSFTLAGGTFTAWNRNRDSASIWLRWRTKLPVKSSTLVVSVNSSFQTQMSVHIWYVGVILLLAGFLTWRNSAGLQATLVCHELRSEWLQNSTHALGRWNSVCLSKGSRVYFTPVYFR